GEDAGDLLRGGDLGGDRVVLVHDVPGPVEVDGAGDVALIVGVAGAGVLGALGAVRVGDGADGAAHVDDADGGVEHVLPQPVHRDERGGAAAQMGGMGHGSDRGA